MKRIAALFLFTVLFAGTAFAARYVWVASEGTELRSSPKGGSEVVSSLRLDERLSVQDKSGRWYKVKSDSGRSGWVYRGKISSSKPERDASKGAPGLFGSLDSDIESGRASTDRAIRGLSPEAEAYAESTGTPESYQKALDSVMERKITRDDVREFLQRGKIGEYAQ